MAYKTLGGPASGQYVKESGDWSFTKTQVTKRTEQWAVNAVDLFVLKPVFDAPHPVFGFVFCTDCKAVDDLNGITRLTITWEGYAGDASGIDISTVRPVYEWNGSLENQQIQLNPRFQTIVAYCISNGYDPTDSEGRFAGFPVGATSDGTHSVAGVTSYNSATGTWTKSWIQRARPSAMEGVGYIGEPEGPAPTFSDGRNWIKGPLTYRQAGSIFECRQTWILSQPGGHSPFYDPPT